MSDVPGPTWTVLDTDVWSWLYAPQKRSHTNASRWRTALTGRSVVIATQTRDEVLAGLASGTIGPRRTAVIRRQLDSTPTVPVTEDVVGAYARLTAECRKAAHGLHDKVHTADRWVAATAIAIGAPLLAIDRIYQRAPSLVLLDV